MSALRALSGETYDDPDFVGQRPAQHPLETNSSSAVRNAANVLPDPVGAAMSVCLPDPMASPAQPLPRSR